MKHGSSTVRWVVDKLLRLAAAVTALSAMLAALIVEAVIHKPETTLSLISSLSLMLFGFLLAIFIGIASFAYWPDRSTKLKTLSIVLLTMIYLSGACGFTLAGAGIVGFAYAKAHGFHFPDRATTALVQR